MIILCEAPTKLGMAADPAFPSLLRPEADPQSDAEMRHPRHPPKLQSRCNRIGICYALLATSSHQRTVCIYFIGHILGLGRAIL